MKRRPLLKEITITLAAKCSICGDILLSRPSPTSKPTQVESIKIAGELLERVFRTHLWDRHHIADEVAATQS